MSSRVIARSYQATLDGGWPWGRAWWPGPTAYSGYAGPECRAPRDGSGHHPLLDVPGGTLLARVVDHVRDLVVDVMSGNWNSGMEFRSCHMMVSTWFSRSAALGLVGLTDDLVEEFVHLGVRVVLVVRQVGLVRRGLVLGDAPISRGLPCQAKTTASNWPARGGVDHFGSESSMTEMPAWAHDAWINCISAAAGLCISL